MNNTEYELLTKGQLLEMVERLQEENEELTIKLEKAEWKNINRYEPELSEMKSNWD